MTVEQWNGMTQREKDETCAKVEYGDKRIVWHDYTAPANYERLKRKAIETPVLANEYARQLKSVLHYGRPIDVLVTFYDAATATPDQVCLASVLTLGRS